jgi:hypothetical protein
MAESACTLRTEAFSTVPAGFRLPPGTKAQTSRLPEFDAGQKISCYTSMMNALSFTQKYRRVKGKTVLDKWKNKRRSRW